MFAFLGHRIDTAAVVPAKFRRTASGTLQSRLCFLGLNEGVCEDHS